jgi:hypothetical protein
LPNLPKPSIIPAQRSSSPAPDHERERLHGRAAPSFQFEDISLDEARRMGRGPRINPELYHALQQNIQSLGNTAVRMIIPEGTCPTIMGLQEQSPENLR